MNFMLLCNYLSIINMYFGSYLLRVLVGFEFYKHDFVFVISLGLLILVLLLAIHSSILLYK